MSIQLLEVVVVALTVSVVIGICFVLWSARTTPRQSGIAVLSGVILAVWATTSATLARRGAFLPEGHTAPLVGIALATALVLLTLCLVVAPSLRAMLTNQRHLILLNLWRLVGVVFLVLMARDQMPALWALPAGIGDVIVGVLAPWVARDVDSPQGRRRAVAFNLFGMADLVVAVGLGTMTSPGPTWVIHTTPTSELATHFPLALVPTFLVPLAFELHVISLWQLLRGSWTAQPVRPFAVPGARSI